MFWIVPNGLLCKQFDVHNTFSAFDLIVASMLQQQFGKTTAEWCTNSRFSIGQELAKMIMETYFKRWY